jgi:hypothetical protein
VLIKIRYIYIYRGMFIEVSTHMYEYLDIYNVSLKNVHTLYNIYEAICQKG